MISAITKKATLTGLLESWVAPEYLAVPPTENAKYVVVTVRGDVPVAWFDTYSAASAWLWTVSDMAAHTICNAADYRSEA